MKRVVKYLLLMVMTACIAKKTLESAERLVKPKKEDPDTPTPIKPDYVLSAEDQKIAENVSLYAEQCKSELGLPAKPLAPWNCLDGTEIPVSVGGSRLDSNNFDSVSKRKVGCDTPAWLGDEPCANYAFIQQRALSDDVDAVLLCRSRHFYSYKDKAERLADYETNQTADNFNLLYAFESLGMIWTNKKTGKTCFFDYVGKVYGGYVPSPDDTKVATLEDLPSPKPPAEMQVSGVSELIWQKSGERTWRRPIDVVNHDNCIRCHDTGAFKSSPWVEQAIKLPGNSKEVPFLVVGKVFEKWKAKFPVRAIDTLPVKNAKGELEPQACTSCHRIGSLATCELHIDYSIGTKSSGIVSDLGKTFYHAVWMPPVSNPANNKTESELRDEWQAKYSQHIDRLKCCCSKPHAKGCLSQNITESPLGKFKEGDSSETCIK